MGKLSNGVQKRKRDGKSILVIDFRFRDKDGREQRYRRDAHVQTRAGAEAEARRLMETAHAKRKQPSPVSTELGCCFFLLGRGGQIRTADLTDPNRARYQPALRPEWALREGRHF